MQEPSGADPSTWALHVGEFNFQLDPIDQFCQIIRLILILNNMACVSFYVSVESMSLRSIGSPGDLSSRLGDNDKARDCIIPMG